MNLAYQEANVWANQLEKHVKTHPVYQLTTDWGKQQKQAIVDGYETYADACWTIYKYYRTKMNWFWSEVVFCLTAFAYGLLLGAAVMLATPFWIVFSAVVVMPEHIGALRTLISSVLFIGLLTLLAALDITLLFMFVAFIAFPKFIHDWHYDYENAKAGKLTLQKVI